MIYLSFDIEEFDLPLEYGNDIDFKQQIEVSREGLNHILKLLKDEGICATFFSTVVFAEQNTDIIKQIIESGNEIASHGYYHSNFDSSHYLSSKEALQQITKVPIKGFRAARMMKISENELLKAGYSYDSSINPTWIPGRYNNFRAKRSKHIKNGILEIPASVTPIVRFPLFWIAFHVLPRFIYTVLAKWTIKKDGYLNVYFHPWEFSEKLKQSQYGVPSYISNCSGDKMVDKLKLFIRDMKKSGYSFGKLDDLRV